VIEDNRFSVFPEQAIFTAGVLDFDEVFCDLKAAFALNTMIFVDTMTNIEEVDCTNN
jgi:hypothetical protein